MCDLTRIKILWHELLPYVDVRPCGHDVINRTGVLYDFFRESLADCCNLPTAIDYLYDDSRLANQQMVLNGVHSTISTVGMPISLDAEFPHTPKEFVPVLQTDGLFWVKVREPKKDTVALGGISSSGLPLFLVVMTMTGYASVILWLFENRSTKLEYFSKSFLKGVLECYWFAFITATTIGTDVGKIFTMLWILCGICLMSTFTAIITAVITSFMAPQASATRPFYDEFIGVLNGSFDYLVLVKKSANSVCYPNTDSLMEALNNGSTFNIVMDKHAYWIYRAKIHQNQSFEFRPGVQNPTSIGYIYNTKNASLLRCMKDYAMQNQANVSARLTELVQDAIDTQPPDKIPVTDTLFFGPHTYTVLLVAIGFFAAIIVAGGLIDRYVRKWRIVQDEEVEDEAAKD